MKQILNATLLILFSSLLFLPTSHSARKDRRQVKQKARIHQGVKSGELTRAERKSLRRGQKRIHKAEKNAGADGEYSEEELAKIEKMQNHQSKKIHRFKHNDRKNKAKTSNDSE